ncbi:hypothetical protein C8R41DRAFT_923368 [Lentinula lateritia]|uniref:Uncharacterized protein n=1 Tax=Lentinula lateritia TaxID=40482 RepID=A0ABQ8V640_9AGAR|nr:hypothetical protein C8R41DRAFT_923368 [Lentinula lateritia]
MPPTPRPTLVPRTLTAHPYRAENQRLAARVCLLESQLADSQRENSSLTSALRDTSHALESRQREVEQLRSSSREVLEHEVEYRRVLDQFLALDEALPGASSGSLLERFRKVQEDLQTATRERNVAVEKLSTSVRKNSHLTTSLLHQQGVVDESNALATRQRRLVEELQEEVHRARGRVAFVDQMIKELSCPDRNPTNPNTSPHVLTFLILFAPPQDTLEAIRTSPRQYNHPPENVLTTIPTHRVQLLLRNATRFRISTFATYALGTPLDLTGTSSRVHLPTLAITRSFPSSVAVSVAPFELQPAPSTLQRKLIIPTTHLRPILTQVLQEYPDEGYYEVVLPPLLQLEGDLNKAREDLRRVATFAHRLYRSDPATVLHHHHRYIGAIIEAVVAFLRRGLNSDDLDVVVHNFRLALDYMQAARGVHGDLYMRSLSSIQWFFNNAVDEDEGLHRMVLDHSRFDNDGPFLTAAQHAGFAPPPNDSLEPPLHRQMLALSTPLPHGDSAGMWDDIIPALPSLDQLTSDWEWLMLQYIHHITDTPLPGPATPAPRPLSEMVVEPSLEAPAVPVSPLPADSPLQVPLFMPEQDSPTSPSPPPPSPTLPPLFGSVANLTIDLTGDDDDELYETGEVPSGSVIEAGEVGTVTSEQIPKNEPL